MDEEEMTRPRQGPEYDDWKDQVKPRMEEDSQRGVLLKEFHVGRTRPSVYLIWEREFGSVDKIGLRCVCTTRATAEVRCKAMKSSTFWEGDDLRGKPRTFFIEECEVDHLFGASMQTLDTLSDEAYASHVASHLMYFIDQDKFERLRHVAAAKIEELEVQLASALERAEAAEKKLEEIEKRGPLCG